MSNSGDPSPCCHINDPKLSSKYIPFPHILRACYVFLFTEEAYILLWKPFPKEIYLNQTQYLKKVISE